METVPAKITSKLKAEMELAIKEGWYANKSEFIRDAVRDKLEKLKLTQMEKFLKEDIEWGLHGND